MDLDRIERLIELFGRSRARELQVESEGWCLSLRRARASAAEVSPARLVHGETVTEAAAAPGETESGEPARISITAPLVGIFRQGAARLQPGDRLEAGEPVGSIESMKILSPVLASEGGEVEEVLVEDGQPVEYGHQLFLLQPMNGRRSEEEEA